MIYIFWEGTIISKWEETHSEEDLLKIGADLLLSGVKSGVPIMTQLISLVKYLDQIKKKLDHGGRLKRSDRRMGLYAVCGLVKGKALDFHDDNSGIFIQAPKSKTTTSCVSVRATM